MKKNILCFGDSNTHGYDAINNGRFSEDERWTCLLEKFLGFEKYHILEEGLSGRTTVFDDPLFEGLNGMSSIFQCMMTHEPIDLLVIMLGTNDTKQRFSVNAINIAKGLERLTRKAISISEAWHSKANVLLIAPVPICAGYDKTFISDEMGQGCVEKSEGLADTYEQIAKLLNCHFLNAGAIPGIKMNPIDLMHLNKESHLLLATELSNIIPNIVPDIR